MFAVAKFFKFNTLLRSHPVLAAVLVTTTQALGHGFDHQSEKLRTDFRFANLLTICAREYVSVCVRCNSKQFRWMSKCANKNDK